ncbi:MAG: non-heme iron oxygenase ferredoxin subunit [Verrucomicrobiae bacterium]|nr:non-heme iron oxygenase ferredoxin subunit [Verrucomicrobiae bacterium]MCB1090805.1 non-heme iron oxygenase ferredoxin subunit [Verrucomicrobiae bacterium]
MSESTIVADEADIEPGSAKRFEVNGRKIAVFNLEGEFFAIADTCTHEEASLSEGAVYGDEVECPLHGACFKIKTGEVTCPPAVSDVESFVVEVDNGKVKVLV